MATKAGGNIQDASISAMLQMCEKKKTTCVLKVAANGRTGRLYLSGGELIAAEVGALVKEKAAFEIISWGKAQMEVESHTVDREKDIQMPLMKLLLAANRLKDERKARKAGDSQPSDTAPADKASPDAPPQEPASQSRPVKKTAQGQTSAKGAPEKPKAPASKKPTPPKTAPPPRQPDSEKSNSEPEPEIDLTFLEADEPETATSKTAAPPRQPDSGKSGSEPEPEIDLTFLEADEPETAAPKTAPPPRQPDSEKSNSEPEPEIDLTFLEADEPETATPKTATSAHQPDSGKSDSEPEPEIELTFMEADSAEEPEIELNIDGFTPAPEAPPRRSPKPVPPVKPTAKPQKAAESKKAPGQGQKKDSEKKAAQPPEKKPSEEKPIEAQQSEPAEEELLDEKPSAAPVAGLSHDIRKLVKDTKEKKRKRLLLVAGISIGSVLLLLAAAVSWIAIFQPRRAQSQYQKLTATLETQSDANAREKTLQAYIDAHPNSPFAQDAKDRITELRRQMHDNEYKETLESVEKIQLDAQYALKARDTYQKFLERHPESERVGEIKQKLDTIPEVMDDGDFEAIKALDPGNHEKRFTDYSNYLLNHPKGKHRDQVERMVMALGEESYTMLEKKVTVCNQNREWDSCVRMCEQFLKKFKDHARASDVARLQKGLNDNREMAQLFSKAKSVEGDPRAQINLYKEYLRDNPNSTVRAEVEAEMKTIEKQVAALIQWQNLQAAARDRKIDVSKRIRDVEDFLRRNPAMANGDEAREVRKFLETEKLLVMKQRQEEDAQRKKSEELQAEFKREQARIAMLNKQMSANLLQAGGRFIDNGNGTMTDSRTKLTWTMLDSHQVLGKCIDYEAARKYVSGLKIGGHGDWRMPTANELVLLFKSKPFYPLKGAAEWYWSSQTFAKGYQEVADIVTSKPETAWSRVTMDFEQCGAVIAVRP